MSCQELLDRLRAELPKHHLEINLYPAGGMIDAEPCEECGSTGDARAMWRYVRGESIDTAIAEIKQRLSGKGSARDTQ
jgi:hypothetical protein